MSHPSCSLRRWAPVAALAAAGILLGLVTPARAQHPGSSFGAPHLAWSGCPRLFGFQCATAQVPLDYRRPRGRTIELAVIKRKATDPAHRIGTLFFNPGGPGVPATAALPALYQTLPSELRQRFDVVGWDPRGVGQSTAVRCFSNPAEAEAFAIALPAAFPVGDRERARWIAAQAELGRRCERRDPELLRHVSTADTARDLDALRSAVGEQRLNYLGISYGTYLGASYANLFPARVRAMVLDGNVDPAAWGEGDASLSTFLRQNSDLGSSRTLARFLDLCGRATPQRCAFSAGTPAATRAKFARLLRRLRAHPQGPFTYSVTVGGVAQTLYTVHPGWDTLADGLQELWSGHTPAVGTAGSDPAPAPSPGYPGFEQQAAVLCSESPNPHSPRGFAQLEQHSFARAGDVAGGWTWTNEVCATWPARAAHPYTGPWNHPTAPVLTIGVSNDPATPYENALAMTRELANAQLLTVAGYGHTALLNPSRCAGRYESRYFIDGSLPPVGKVCPQDTPPFSAPTGSGAAGRDAAVTGGRRGGASARRDQHGGILVRHPLRLAP